MKRRFTLLMVCLMLSLGAVWMPFASATELPASVLHYLRMKDPNLKVRFDGMVLLSNGDAYVPVIPQDPALNPEPQQVIATIPEQADFPDFIQFDNHYFLMRLIQTASGRLTFPKLDEYPIQLKEGLLPQDFVLPENLFIPVELKVILGSLPYNPTYTPPAADTVIPPASSMLRGSMNAGNTHSVLPAGQRLTYVFDLNEQRIRQIDPLTGRKLGDISMDCVPSTLKVSGDGSLLFAPCLSTNELVVVDTSANLVKTRVPVGQRPDAVVSVDALRLVAVSNRYSQFLSLVNVDELLTAEKIALPGNGGAMTLAVDGSDRLLVADTSKPQVYVVDLKNRLVTQTLKGLPDISAIRMTVDAKGRGALWIASRSKHQVAVLDMGRNVLVKTFDVGQKPVDLTVGKRHTYVLSAGNAQLDVIDRSTGELLNPIALTPESFPTAMMFLPSEGRAYVTMANAEQWASVDLENGQLENIMPVQFRASLVAMTPDVQEKLPDVTLPDEEQDSEAEETPALVGSPDGTDQKALESESAGAHAEKKSFLSRIKPAKRAGKEGQAGEQAAGDNLSAPSHASAAQVVQDSETPKEENPLDRKEKKSRWFQKSIPAASESEEQTVSPAAAVPSSMGMQPHFGALPTQGGGRFTLKLGNGKKEKALDIETDYLTQPERLDAQEPDETGRKAGSSTTQDEAPLLTPLDDQLTP